MSTTIGTAPGKTRISLASIRNLMRDKPIIPLILLLALLLIVLEMVRPGIVNERWVGNQLKFAVPLAILAAAQTLTMLTGGIDLSVGVVATMTAFVMVTLVPSFDPVIAIPLALLPAALAGLASGIGVGIFRVHPLIMTLAVGLVAEGLLLVYARTMLDTRAVVPEVIAWLGTGRTSILDILGNIGLDTTIVFGHLAVVDSVLDQGIPNNLVVFIPLALFIGFMLRRMGFGRNLYAIGDNEAAARLSGVRVWQVQITLYVISGLLAGLAGIMYMGFIKSPNLTLALPLLLPSVAAAVIGGTSIFGGRGGYAGTIVGVLILTALGTLLTFLQIPEGARRVIFGGLILGVTALYVRATEDR